MKTIVGLSCYTPYVSDLPGMMTPRVPSYRYFFHCSDHTLLGDDMSDGIVASRNLFTTIKTRLIRVIWNLVLNTTGAILSNIFSSTNHL